MTYFISNVFTTIKTSLVIFLEPENLILRIAQFSFVAVFKRVPFLKKGNSKGSPELSYLSHIQPSLFTFFWKSFSNLFFISLYVKFFQILEVYYIVN